MSPDDRPGLSFTTPLALAWIVGLISICVSSSIASVAAAQSDGVTLRTLLSHRTVVEKDDAEPGRLARLPLSREVVERCQSDLSDLRLLDGDRLVPTYLRRQAVTATESTRVQAVVRSARRGADGNAAGDPVSQSETYELARPSSWTDDGSWRLEVAVGPVRSSFARDVELAWIDGSAVTRQRTQTVFRLTDGREHSTLDLPTGTTQTLRVRLRGPDRSATLDPLEPNFFFVRERQIVRNPPTLEIELELHPADEEGFSHRAELPAGFFADALRFETTTANFLRRVTVGERTTEGTIEVLTHAWIQSSEEPARTQTVRLTAGRAAQPTPAADARFELLLDIDGGDSPPLEQLRVLAVLPQPELVFEWPTGTERLDLYFGGGRVRAARFDLERAAGRRWFPTERSELTWSLLGEAVLPTARLGETETNPRFNPAPLLGFLQRPGASLDLEAFRDRAAMDLPATPAGLYRIQLPQNLLTRVRADFADLRFTPSETEAETANQLPYLIEPAERWTVDLTVQGPTVVDSQTTRTRLELPDTLRSDRAGALRPHSVRLVFDQPYFDRDVRLEVFAADQAVQQLARRITTSSPSDAFYEPRRQTSSIVLPIDADRFATTPLSALVLEVEDGDDAPARITHAELRGSGWQALLVATPGRYQALIGATGTMELEAPSYELQRAADFVTALRGTEVDLGAIEPNPAASSPGWLSSWSGNWQQLALWAAILIAVLALGWITLRSVSG